MNEIKDLAENGPTAEEMTKLKNQLINDEVRARQSSMARAQQLAQFALYDGDRRDQPRVKRFENYAEKSKMR